MLGSIGRQMRWRSPLCTAAHTDETRGLDCNESCSQGRRSKKSELDSDRSRRRMPPQRKRRYGPHLLSCLYVSRFFSQSYALALVAYALWKTYGTLERWEEAPSDVRIFELARNYLKKKLRVRNSWPRFVLIVLPHLLALKSGDNISFLVLGGLPMVHRDETCASAWATTYNTPAHTQNQVSLDIKSMKSVDFIDLMTNHQGKCTFLDENSVKSTRFGSNLTHFSSQIASNRPKSTRFRRFGGGGPPFFIPPGSPWAKQAEIGCFSPWRPWFDQKRGSI